MPPSRPRGGHAILVSFAEARRFSLAEARMDSLSATARALAYGHLAPGEPVAVQCWVSGEAATAFGSQNLFHGIAAELDAHGRQAQRAGTDRALSACIHGRGVSLGLATRKQALSDWPGGRVRLARAKGSVSRAEFKLEELFQTASLPLPRRGRAMDLGAAPGGWTRILRERGLEVWAVDPGDLAPSLVADPLVHHERTTSGPFIRSMALSFDMAVNDMRMTPKLSCETISALQSTFALYVRQHRWCQELLAAPWLPRCRAKNRIELSISKSGTSKWLPGLACRVFSVH